MSDRRVAALLSDDISGEIPPTEFRVFKAGRNDTLEGPYFFTEKSAQSVIDARSAWGAECMIDLEHLSTDKSSPNYDPDARGWFDLELRDGELWAVDVRWTEDGADRLAKKKQKYISPAFYHTEQGEIEALFNVALVAMPKTMQAIALANAAFKKGSKMAVDIATVVSVAKALGASTVGEVKAAIGGDMDIATLESFTKALGDSSIDEFNSFLNGFTGMGSKEPEKKEPAPATPEKAPEMAANATEDPEKDQKLMAQNSALFNENAQLKHRVAELGAQIAKTESKERLELVGELVKLGAEIPATAWANVAGNVPVKRLVDEPLDSLRDRVAKLSAVPRSGSAAIVPTTESNGLSQDEIRICKETGCPPEKFAEIKAARSVK